MYRFGLRSLRNVSASVKNIRAPVVRFSSTEAKTPLYDAHVAAGGKIVPFCGYLLPVQYTDSLAASHAQVRTKAGLFDVSHMGQVKIKGEHRIQFLETMCVTDLVGLKENIAKLTVLTTDKGGVYDDCMVTKMQDHLFMVLNAGCKHKDMQVLKAAMDVFNKEHPSSDPVTLEYLDQRALVALQGPEAAQVLGKLIKTDLTYVAFMHTFEDTIAGIPVAITRCGYTGEDGFEIGCESEHAVKLWDTILADTTVRPAGLGVRDSLRLEAGLCLYGHELDETVTPVEANLSWTISPRRKREGGFNGADVILEQLKNGPPRKLMGVKVLEGAPARQGAILLNQNDEEIGIVTSGGPAPSLNMQKIALAYIKSEYAQEDQDIKVSVRGKVSKAQTTKLPFVPTHYYRVPKN